MTFKPESLFSGRVRQFDDNIDTDTIIAGRHLGLTDPAELASYCFESIRPNFSSEINKGDVIVAGENFGCGSSREHAPIALKAAGISCIVAASAAHIFYRSAFNIGLPILLCADAAKMANENDSIHIDMTTGNVKIGEQTFATPPLPKNLREIIDAGGLVPLMAERLSGSKY